jgi:hypothetical protein
VNNTAPALRQLSDWKKHKKQTNQPPKQTEAGERYRLLENNMGILRLAG